MSGLSYLFDNQMFLTGSYVDIHNTPLVMVSSFVKGWSNINWLIVLSIPQKIFFKEYFMNERGVFWLIFTLVVTISTIGTVLDDG